MPFNWGAVALGAISGMGSAMVIGAPLLAIGLADTKTLAGQSLLILLGFAAQFLAGWVAARFSGRVQPLHGALAALAAFSAVSTLSLAAGSDPGTGAFVFGAIVALVLGTAGGVLAQARERPAGR